MSLLLPIVALGLLASLSPATIIVFILVLATTRARVNAIAFLIGWGVSLTIVFAVAYVIGGSHGLRQGGGRVGVDVVEIVLGVALVAAGVGRWQRRNIPRHPSGASKALADRVSRLRPWEATVLGVLKEPWSITAAAAVVVVHHHTALVVALLAFLVFSVVSTATVGLAFWYQSSHPTDAETLLSKVKDLLVRLGPAIVAAVSVVVGSYLIADGVVALLR